MWRMILLAGASVAALASTAADAASFVYTGTVQTYTVTQTGIYVLRAAGAQGGASQNAGGAGAVFTGRLSLTSGTVLNVVVGGQGGDGPGGVLGGGGGGGSFIYDDLATPLAIAGGGGGSGLYFAGGGGSANYGGAAYGGSGAVSPGGARGTYGTGGGGGEGGGGKGGGGGGGFSGGGGGGYSGFGGGGGSKWAADVTDVVLTAGVNTGNGSASIDLFTGGVPEPSSWAMLITGFGGIGAMLRRRRLRTA